MPTTIIGYDDCDTLMKKLQEKINELKEENIRLIKENEKIRDEKFKDETIIRLKNELSEIRSSPVYVPNSILKEIKEYRKQHQEEYQCEDFKYVIGSTYISNYVDVVCCVKDCKCKEKEKTFWY